MKLYLENIQTKVGKLVNQSIELGDGEPKITIIFESPNVSAVISDIDSNTKEFKSCEPLYNTLIVCGDIPFIVFSVHYDRRYITRKFRNYRQEVYAVIVCSKEEHLEFYGRHESKLIVMRYRYGLPFKYYLDEEGCIYNETKDGREYLLDDKGERVKLP